LEEEVGKGEEEERVRGGEKEGFYVMGNNSDWD
jgi:hypothetical protein